ncbi:MAG: MATE family efflux transporter [Candidatus Thermoplasmatota archaeon]|nr:MATE family efflux transporter [Candidatus Thermoplasmatota archaeon]
MSKTYTYARNMLANWSGYIANLLVSFFLSPFIVHSLGNSAYGVWSLLISLTGYLGLIEMGVMNGTGRYINYYLGRKEPQKVSYIVNTSLVFYCAVGVLLLLAALAFSASFSQLFSKIPPQLAQQAQIALPIIAVNILFGFVAATFRQLPILKSRSLTLSKTTKSYPWTKSLKGLKTRDHFAVVWPLPLMMDFGIIMKKPILSLENITHLQPFS